MQNYTLWQNIATLIGRILFGLVFIAAGIEKVIHYNAATSALISHGVPFAGIVVIIYLVLEILAGFAVLVGIKTRWAAGLLLLLVLISIFVFREYSPVGFMILMAHISVISAALYIIAFGAGRFSLEGRKV